MLTLVHSKCTSEKWTLLKIIGSTASKRKNKTKILGESIQSGLGVNVNQPGVCNQINLLILPDLGEDQKRMEEEKQILP